MQPIAWLVDGPHPLDSSEVFLLHEKAVAAFNDWGKQITPLYRRATPAQPAGMREALNKFSDFINEPPQYEDQRMVRDYRHELAREWIPLFEKLLSALALPAERPAVAQAVPEPTAEQLAILARYLESQSDRLTKALDNPSWTPRRSHVEGNRNAFVAAANTLDQALRAASPVTSTVRHSAED